MNCAPTQQSPSKKSCTGQVLYELPSCTICLQELSEDLSSLDCGHVFHLGCISQQFEYRNSCPNCQKRASMKEVRIIHFRHTPNNSRVQAQIKAVLTSLPPTEKKQVQSLMKEVRQLSEANEKMKGETASLESSLKAKTKVVEGLRQEIYKLKVDGDKFISENRRLNEACKQLTVELNDHLRVEMKLKVENERLRQEEKEFEQVKRYKRLLAENSQEIVNYKAELESRFTPPEEIAKAFYDMLLMKNLEILRAKQKLSELPQRLSQKEHEVGRLKQRVDTLRKEAKEMGDKRTRESMRHQELKEKYRILSEKARSRGIKEVEILPIDENSQGFSNKSVHIPDDPVIQSTIRKPFFGHGFSTIGGFTFKKKDDKLKTTL